MSLSNRLTEGLGDETIGGGLSGIRATKERVQRRRTRAVSDGDGTSELDEVGRRQVAVLLEWLHDRDDLVQADVCVILRLGVGEDHD